MPYLFSRHSCQWRRKNLSILPRWHCSSWHTYKKKKQKKKRCSFYYSKQLPRKEPTPLNEHLQRRWETGGPPCSTHSKRRVMFTFSHPHWDVGVKLNGGGLRNQWVAQGLLRDRGDPDLAVLLAATNARVCACRCACVPLWCSQSSGACYFVNARRNLKMSRCFPKVHQIHACDFFSCM